MNKIPTYLVTGFLGAGKTSLINQLLAARPSTEQWAVIVNEFGQVGVDGALLQKSSGIHIRQVTGGCICCTTAPLMRTALIRLLREQRPDRLIIEPSGLGHPAGILALLQESGFAAHLAIQPVICIVSCQSLSDPRYLQSPEFNAQIAAGSILIITQGEHQSPAENTAQLLALQGQYPDKTILLAPALTALPEVARQLIRLSPQQTPDKDNFGDLPPTPATTASRIATGRWYNHQEHTRLSLGIRWSAQLPKYLTGLETSLATMLATTGCQLLRGKALLMDAQQQWHEWQWTNGQGHWSSTSPSAHQFFEIIIENADMTDVQPPLQQQIAGLWKQGAA